MGVSVVVSFLGAVLLANWLIDNIGVVPVGFGMTAPAGVYALAPALLLRDLVQWMLGKPVAGAALAAGAVLSHLGAGPVPRQVRPPSRPPGAHGAPNR
jgi:uncharacterized PurR-regulated membrane protein YhhQ (DUF165 family)